MKKTARMALVAGLAALALTACGDRGSDGSDGAADATSDSASPTPTASNPDFKACMVSDSGGFDDKSFNQTALKGLTDAETSQGISTGKVESNSDSEYADNINALVEAEVQPDHHRGLPAG